MARVNELSLVLTSSNDSSTHEGGRISDVHLCGHHCPWWYSRYGHLILVHLELFYNFTMLSREEVRDWWEECELTYCDDCVCLPVCLSVCLSAHVTRKPRRQTSTNFCACCRDRGSILLWRRCDMLCTSGCADYVMFSCHWTTGQNQAWRYIYNKFIIWLYQLDVTILQCLVEFISIRTRVKCAIYIWLVGWKNLRSTPYKIGHFGKCSFQPR